MCPISFIIVPIVSCDHLLMVVIPTCNLVIEPGWWNVTRAIITDRKAGFPIFTFCLKKFKLPIRWCLCWWPQYVHVMAPLLLLLLRPQTARPWPHTSHLTPHTSHLTPHTGWCWVVWQQPPWLLWRDFIVEDWQIFFYFYLGPDLVNFLLDFWDISIFW